MVRISFLGTVAVGFLVFFFCRCCCCFFVLSTQDIINIVVNNATGATGVAVFWQYHFQFNQGGCNNKGDEPKRKQRKASVRIRLPYKQGLTTGVLLLLMLVCSFSRLSLFFSRLFLHYFSHFFFFVFALARSALCIFMLFNDIFYVVKKLSVLSSCRCQYIIGSLGRPCFIFFLNFMHISNLNGKIKIKIFRIPKPRILDSTCKQNLPGIPGSSFFGFRNPIGETVKSSVSHRSRIKNQSIVTCAHACSTSYTFALRPDWLFWFSVSILIRHITLKTTKRWRQGWSDIQLAMDGFYLPKTKTNLHQGLEKLRKPF